MPIFINDSLGKSTTIRSCEGFMEIEPDNLEIVFDRGKIRFSVSLLSNGSLKVIKLNKEGIDEQQKKLISSLANEIIIC